MEKSDYDRLRRELEDYYGTAMFSGLPLAIAELSEVQDADDDELEELAKVFKGNNKDNKN